MWHGSIPPLKPAVSDVRHKSLLNYFDTRRRKRNVIDHEEAFVTTENTTGETMDQVGGITGMQLDDALKRRACKCTCRHNRLAGYRRTPRSAGGSIDKSPAAEARGQM